MSNSIRIGIVGAGVVGLSNALQVIENVKNAKVTVFAEEFTNATTTCGSAGSWKPYQVANTPVEKVSKWSKDALDHFLELYYSEHADDAGIQQMAAIQLFRKHEKMDIPGWKDIAINFKVFDSKDIRKMGVPEEYSKGYGFTSVIVDQRYYLPFIMQKLRAKGVVFIQQKIESLDEMAKHFDVIINCSGLGARTLVPDPQVRPVRGQVVRVKAPWLKSAYSFNNGDAEKSSYILPNIDSVIIGGTAEVDNYSTSISKETTETIIERAAEVFPALRKATILAEWAGLRPVRDSVRVELDTKQQSDAILIHCYGHGGCGVTMGMGTAMEAVQEILLPELSKRMLHRSKL